MNLAIPRVSHFLPGLALILLQACGGGASQLGPDDLGAADEELGVEEGATPDCAVPAICQLCDDGTCATPHVEVVNGECGPVTYTCESAPTGSGNTSSPTAPPCDPGQTPTAAPPSAPDCPVPAICQLCEDGTCATANVAIVNGECGPVTFSCDSAPEVGTAQPPTSTPSSTPPSEPNCPVPAICQLCEDGTCATAEVEYKDGECGAVRFSCPQSVEGSAGSAAGGESDAHAQQ